MHPGKKVCQRVLQCERDRKSSDAEKPRMMSNAAAARAVPTGTFSLPDVSI